LAWVAGVLGLLLLEYFEFEDFFVAVVVALAAEDSHSKVAVISKIYVSVEVD
jgi:Na+/H+ antiporter NhaC